MHPTHASLSILLSLALLATACEPAPVDSKDRPPLDDTEDSSTDTQDSATDTGDSEDTSDTVDTHDTHDTGDTGEEGCRSAAPAADRDRLVVFSLPYNSSGRPASTWMAMLLNADGTLRDDSQSFTMGRSTMGELVFTPDGSLGLVPQEDGTLGVFAVDEDNRVTVVHASFDGGFYAGRVIVDPSGERAWILDGNWINNGGGIYQVAIDCESGELSGATRVLEAKLPADLLPLSSDRAVLLGWDVEGSEGADDLALLDWSDSPSFLAGVDAFGDNEAIVSDGASIGDLVFAGDNSAFSGASNRIAAARVLGDSMEELGTWNVNDPVSLLASPWGDALLVVSGYDNAFYRFTVDYEASRPLTAAGELSYVGAPPQLPSSAGLIEVGSLRGLAIVAETQGIRMIRFQEGGTVQDLGLTTLGDGYEYITGALGVAP